MTFLGTPTISPRGVLHCKRKPSYGFADPAAKTGGIWGLTHPAMTEMRGRQSQPVACETPGDLQTCFPANRRAIGEDRETDVALVLWYPHRADHFGDRERRVTSK